MQPAATPRREATRPTRVCIVGASGKLGRYLVQHCLDRGYQVVGVCREKSVAKLDTYADRIEIVPGPTDDRDAIARAVATRVARWLRVVDIDDQVEACRRIFASDARWTVVRGSDLEEGESQGLPVWSRHVGDPVLASNRTRRTDFALFMVEAIGDDALVHEAPAIVGGTTPSALAHAGEARTVRTV